MRMPVAAVVWLLWSTLLLPIGAIGCVVQPFTEPQQTGVDGGVSTSAAGAPRYRLLSETGLYADLASGALAEGVVEYTPAYPLWSDGSHKRRWIKLPAGTSIDARDLDHWRFPVGTKLWKEFAIASGAAIVRVETRLVEVVGPGDAVWLGGFAWRDDGSDAELAADGAAGVRGTDHDVPAMDECLTCHAGEPSRVLGFSALQLSHDGPGNFAAWRERLAPVPPQSSYPVPGAGPEQQALGYLHGNCGHCHQPGHESGMELRVRVTDADVADTGAYRTAVDQPLSTWAVGGFERRIAAGRPDASGVVARMHVRGRGQMPPAFTKRVDASGAALVIEWIRGL